MYAIIETGGKQYKVSANDTLRVEKLEANVGDKVTFDKVLVVSDAETVFGAPYIAGKTVSATVVEQGKAKKVVVFTYKSKKNEKRKMGHRQPYTKVEISAINA